MDRDDIPHRLLIMAVLLFFSATVRAVEIPHAINVDALGGNEFKIVIRTEIRAAPRTVWTVLTDFDHHADWLPFMIESRVVSHLPGTLFVEQEGAIRVVKTYTIRVKQQVWENAPAGRLRFHAVDGDFRKLDGLWTILPAAPGQTTLLCWFTMEPYRHAPEWAVKFIVKRYLSVMVHRLQDQAEIEGRKSHG